METNKNTNDKKQLEKSEQSLNDFLNEYKSIEYLWKNVEKKKNSKKSELRESETKLVKATTDLGNVVGKLNEENKKNSYDEIIKGAYGNNLKGAEKFIEKFPNWSIAIGKIFSESPHYQRIVQSASKTRTYKDITSKSDFELKRTGKGKIKGDGILNKIKSGWKSLKTAFSNYIKPDDIGKASKSSLARRIKKFGEEINRPWRMWWDFAAGEKIKLSKDVAKKKFKEELDNGASPTIQFFNYGTEADSGTHEYAIDINKKNYQQSKEFQYMNSVVKDLDKNLLKDVSVVFKVDTTDIESNIENSTKITASKIFQAKNRQPANYEQFFSILGITDYYDNKKDDEIVNKISELLKEIEGEEKLNKLAGDKNVNIKNFLQLARANYVIKNNKMEEQSKIVENLNTIIKIFNINAKEVNDKTLLNKDTNGNDLSENTKTIIDEIEKNWDKEIAKKFKDAINNILAPTDKQLENIKTAKKALNEITTDVNQCEKLTTEGEVEKAIQAIQTCKNLTDETNTSGCRYDAKNGRKEFLVDVAVRLGVRGITESNIQDLCKSQENLKSPYNKMEGALLVQKLRNLIGYGLGYGTNKVTGWLKKNSANSLPDLNNINDTKNNICEKLLEIKKK